MEKTRLEEVLERELAAIGLPFERKITREEIMLGEAIDSCNHPVLSRKVIPPKGKITLEEIKKMNNAYQRIVEGEIPKNEFERELLFALQRRLTTIREGTYYHELENELKNNLYYVRLTAVKNGFGVEFKVYKKDSAKDIEGQDFSVRYDRGISPADSLEKFYFMTNDLFSVYTGSLNREVNIEISNPKSLPKQLRRDYQSLIKSIHKGYDTILEELVMIAIDDRERLVKEATLFLKKAIK